MKVLASLTFLAFIVGLAIRFSDNSSLYDYKPMVVNDQNVESIKESSGEERKTASLFDQRPEQIRKQLNDLSAVYPTKTESKEELLAKSLALELERSETSFKEELMSSSNNLSEMEAIQGAIRRLKMDMNQELTLINNWDVRFILTLIYREDFSFEEIYHAQVPSDLGFSNEEIDIYYSKMTSPALEEYILALKSRDYDRINEVEKYMEIPASLAQQGQSPKEKELIKKGMNQMNSWDGGRGVSSHNSNGGYQGQTEDEYRQLQERELNDFKNISVEELESRLAKMNYSQEEIDQIFESLDQE